MRVLLFICMLILAIGIAEAADSSIKIGLQPSGVAREKIDIEFTAMQDANQVEYSLLNKPENLVVFEGNNELNHEITSNEFYDIIIDKEVRKGQTYRLRLEFDIKGLVSQSDNNYIFSFRYEPSESLNNFNLDVNLPRGFVLSDIESAASPSGYNIRTDGKDIQLSWNLRNIDMEQSFIIIYERGIISNSGLITGFVIASISLAAIVGVILFYRKEKKEIVSGVLSADEKKIVSMIEANGEITQKQIVKDTGFSKAKVSKIIRRLEEKGIVEKTPYMATNKLRIKNKIKR